MLESDKGDLIVLRCPTEPPTPPPSYEECFGAGAAADDDDDRILELLHLIACWITMTPKMAWTLLISQATKRATFVNVHSVPMCLNDHGESLPFPSPIGSTVPRGEIVMGVLQS